MKIDAQELQAVSTAQAAPRFDMYAGIHKAMRALMTDTLLAAGRMDVDDALDLAQTCRRVTELLHFCVSHLKHENEFVHVAMEARAPGASAQIAHEHEEHEAHIAGLARAIETLLKSEPAERSALALDMYRQLAIFIAENFKHMHVEETAHNAVLWAHYADAELIDIHNALLATIPPAEMMFVMRWLVPFMNPAERTAMMGDMQAHAPASAFNAALDVVQPHLSDIEWAKLTRSLAIAPEAGLVET